MKLKLNPEELRRDYKKLSSLNPDKAADIFVQRALREEILTAIVRDPSNAATVLASRLMRKESSPILSSEEKYLALLQRVLKEGVHKGDRTGTGQIELFGCQLDMDLTDGFPLLTTKKVWWKGVVEELLWMIRGGSNVRSLQDKGVRIWDEWADENGDLGPVYGKQWRSWLGVDRNRGRVVIDQLTQAIDQIRKNPDSRRIMVSAWNVADIEHMRLPPCHVLFQFSSQLGPEGKMLHCHMYQRSADLFLGVPFNIASYALLTHMVALVTGHQAGRLIISFGSTHIYANHVDQVKEQLSRMPTPAPLLDLRLHCSEVREIDDFIASDIMEALYEYQPQPAIKAPIAV